MKELSVDLEVIIINIISQIPMSIWLYNDGRTVVASTLGQDIKSPRRPNIAHYMHPIKRFRRSIARPKRTAPLYPDVDHGVAVGRPRRFCFIAPIAFVGGMGG